MCYGADPVTDEIEDESVGGEQVTTNPTSIIPMEPATSSGVRHLDQVIAEMSAFLAMVPARTRAARNAGAELAPV